MSFLIVDMLKLRSREDPNIVSVKSFSLFFLNLQQPSVPLTWHRNYVICLDFCSTFMLMTCSPPLFPFGYKLSTEAQLDSGSTFQHDYLMMDGAWCFMLPKEGEKVLVFSLGVVTKTWPLSSLVLSQSLNQGVQSLMTPV